MKCSLLTYPTQIHATNISHLPSRLAEQTRLKKLWDLMS